VLQSRLKNSLKSPSTKVSKPFFETLQKWLFSGELYDPYLEFFVTVDPELAHLQYVYPSSLSTGAGIMAGDSGFSGLNADQDDLTGERESGLRLWQAKYKFRQEMLPAFVGEGFGNKESWPIRACPILFC
jgi:gamma-tubulin complex component 3